MSKRIGAGLGAVLVVSLAAAGRGAALYSITPLGTLPGYPDGSGANAINDQGVVAGWSGLGAYTPFVWSRGTGMRDLGIPDGYTWASAVGVNPSGQVAVEAVRQLPIGPPGFTEHAFRWDSGAYTKLGTLGGSLSEPHGIDAAGRVTGIAYTGDGSIHAFRSNGNALTDIDSLGGNCSLGYAIDAAGDVVGQARMADGLSHAFLWPGAGSMQDLGTLGGSQSSATAISSSGRYIAGISGYSVGPARGFIWQAGVMKDIDTEAPAGLNDAGRVVGTYTSNGIERAFVWDAADGFHDLAPLLDPAARAHWALSDANGINNLGQIVGQGTYNGMPMAYLLDPVPEPATAPLATSATLLLPRRRRSRGR